VDYLCIADILLWILYEFSVIFAFFSKIFCSEIVNFRRPPWPPKIVNTIFGICLFSAAVKGPPKIINNFRRLDPGHRKYGLIFGYFFWRPETVEISLRPPKIAYFRRQWPYFRRFLAAENDCSSCSDPCPSLRGNKIHQA
jgi:hypothetical protein